MAVSRFANTNQRINRVLQSYKQRGERSNPYLQSKQKSKETSQKS